MRNKNFKDLRQIAAEKIYFAYKIFSFLSDVKIEIFADLSIATFNFLLRKIVKSMILYRTQNECNVK